MTRTLFSLAMLLASIVAVAAFVRPRLASRPRSGAALVRVPAQVISQNRLTLRWTIRYPLPDGSPHDLLVERTLPEHLREGMAVAVLVDPTEPTRARLDMPERSRFIRTLLIAVAVFIIGGFVIAGAVAALLSSLG